MLRGLLVAGLLMGSAALVPSTADADGTQSIPYTCDETTEPDVGLAPDTLAAPLPITAEDSVETAKIFQQVTWTASLGFPAIDPPITVYFDSFKVTIPIPEDVAVLSATLANPTGQTANPPLADVSITRTATEIVVELPKLSRQDLQHRIRIREHPTTHLTEVNYPETEGGLFTGGTAVVLPVVTIVGVPLPAASGTTINWVSPVVSTAINIGDATYSCDADEATTIVSTDVGTTRQLCDGRGVTVQLGYNAPTGAADVIQGRSTADTANGGGGGDRFCGLGGVDTFHGAAGNDRALGAAGNDKLFGDAGDDRLQGDAGTDTLNGGAGRDNLIGGTQRDTCVGGTQHDTASTCEVKQSIP
jgi:hypothetical protein